jgi:hypothetical protein
MDEEEEYRNNLIKQGYVKPIMSLLNEYNNDDNYYITKQSIINILFEKVAKKQKILRKANKMKVWEKGGNIFKQVAIIHTTCKKGCNHSIYECYDNKVYYERVLLKLNINNIYDKVKDPKYDFYWINKEIFKDLKHFLI